MRAAERFAGGEVDGQNLRFPPSAAEFCVEVRRCEAALGDERRRALLPPATRDAPPVGNTAFLRHWNGLTRSQQLDLVVAGLAPRKREPLRNEPAQSVWDSVNKRFISAHANPKENDDNGRDTNDGFDDADLDEF